MANKNIVKANIGNALHSVAEDHISVVATDVFDERTQKYQSEVNEEQETEIKENKDAITQLDKKVDRNLLAIEYDDDSGNLYAILGTDTTIKNASTDDDGNVIIEQEIK